MDDTIIISSRDSLLMAIPFFLLLFISVFGLGGYLTNPRSPMSRRPAPRGLDENGEPIFTDPDGRVVKPRRKRK